MTLMIISLGKVVSFISYIAMALTFISHWYLGLFTLALFYILHRKHLVVATEQFKPISGANFYAKCEKLIKEEIGQLDAAELGHEAKLTRVTDKGGGPSSIFYPEKKIAPENALFSWKSKNLTHFENIIIIGINERSTADDFVPFGWMSGTFVTLKIVDSSMEKKGDEDKESQVDYYALVAYVRKDTHGGNELELEWDRWSLRTVRNFLRRETAVEAAETFTIETFLCSYGSCACAACQCGVEGANRAGDGGEIAKEEERDPGFDEEEEDEEAYKKSRTKSEQSKGKVEVKKASSGKRIRKKRKKYGLATALALSTKGRTHSKSTARGRSNSRSGSISKSNSAVAESNTNEGRSGSYSNGAKSSVAESSSRTGDTKSYSKAKKGYAQSSSQSYGGKIEATATKSGEQNETEYNYYDEDGADDKDDIDFEFDAKTLIRDTDHAFMEAYNRSASLKSHTKFLSFRDDLCLRENIMETNLTLVEWKILVTKGNVTTDAGSKVKNRHKNDPIFLFKNLLRYGIDVELGVNTSVLISSVIPGYAAPRSSCCDLNINPSTTVGSFLTQFKQDCNSDLETQVLRLEKSFNDANFAKIMQKKKLNLNQLRDMIPMILLKHYTNHTIRHTVWNVSVLFNNNISEDIKLVVAIIVNAAQYSAKEGYLHKVKILKGLALNVRTVFTGIMLETKKCMKEPKLCDEETLIRLDNEKRLILGLYLFLKFADSRFAYFSNWEATALFVDFLKVHENAIDTLASCKSRRVILTIRKFNQTKTIE